MNLYTDTDIALVFRLWDDGLPASAISERFGYDNTGKLVRTRSSILSLVHRKHPNPARNQAMAKATRKRLKFNRKFVLPPEKPPVIPLIMAPPPPPVVEPIPDMSESDIPVSNRVKLLDLGNRDCKWPLGGHPGDDPDFGFCGKPQFNGVRGNHANFGRSCYCLQHYRKSMRKEWLAQFDKALAREGEVRSP